MAGRGSVSFSPARQPRRRSTLPPKNAYDGHADLMGIWQAKATVGDDIEKSIVDPSNKKIPYLPAAAAKAKANAANKAKLDPVGKCYMPGIPRLIT